MSDLVRALERFNRKERNWLVRDALGAGAVALCPNFRGRLSECMRLVEPGADVPDRAWWSTDFHIDWLIGAMAILDKGEGTIGTPWPDLEGLVRGNQQDIDLIIAWGNTLVLVEAKGVGSWSGSGTTQKLERLSSLPSELFERVNVFLVFCSPGDDGKPDSGWPGWLRNGPQRLHLKLARPEVEKSLLRVERCKPAQSGFKRGKGGKSWRIVETE